MKKLVIGVATCLFALSASIASAQMSRLSEAQIALIVVTANTIDIKAGKLAIQQSKNKEVLDFARQMVSDHTAVNKAATDLVKKLKIKPAQSDNVKNLKEDAAEVTAKLKKLKGPAFDKAYIDNEVTYHQAIIDGLDNNLIPGARNEEFKALLESVRPAFVAHRDHAKSLLQSLQ